MTAMTCQATRYTIRDLTDMLVPRQIPEGTKVVVKLAITSPTQDVVWLLIKNSWAETSPQNWAIWCVEPAEVDAARDGLRPHFGEPDANGIARGK